MPGEPDADVDGCNGPKNVWEGACIQGQTLGPDGTHFVLHPPIALRPPAGAINNKCDCNPGYRVVEVGGWDDSTRTPSGVYDPWTGSEAGTADPAIAQIMQQPNGKESSRQKIDWYTRTLLYTCMAQ